MRKRGKGGQSAIQVRKPAMRVIPDRYSQTASLTSIASTRSVKREAETIAGNGRPGKQGKADAEYRFYLTTKNFAVDSSEGGDVPGTRTDEST